MTQEPKEAAVDQFAGEYASVIEAPEGPLVWKANLGLYLREFTADQMERSRELQYRTLPALNYHVPTIYRGRYKPSDLPEAYSAGIDWRVDKNGFVLCTADKLKSEGLCESVAQHRSGLCVNHGGALCPFDKRPDIDPNRDPSQNKGKTGSMDISKLTRWDQLIAGIISVDDLDNEELARGQCRDINGTFKGVAPKMVPKSLHDAMMRSLLSRAQEHFRAGLIDSVDALVSIAKGTAFEPADRIKAASIVIDRVMGKTPEVLITAEAKPWETIFDNISRKPDTESAAYKRLEAAIDAEVVENEPDYGAVLDKPVWGPGLNDGQSHQTLKEIPEPTDFGVPHPDHVGPYTTPPSGPDDRMSYELAKNYEVPVAEKGDDWKEQAAAERRKRYAARAQGHENVEYVAFLTDVTTIHEPTDEALGVYLVRFLDPANTKVPTRVLNAEARARRYSRD